MLAEGDPEREKQLRRMSIYDFNFWIQTMQKKRKMETGSFENEPFGVK